MTNRKTTRRALFMSVISLMLCCAMLVGTTFAWFTDEVTSVNNIIKAGNLDVELYYKNGANGSYAAVGSDPLFSSSLWEPGHVEMVNLKVSNLGTLALKYQLNVSVINEKGGINKAGEDFLLSDYIRYAVLDGDNYATREAAVAAAGQGTAVNGLNWTKSNSILANGADQVVTLVVWMPETVGNDANYKTGTNAPEITLGINLYATQLENESDSFGDDYDEDAWVDGFDVYTEQDLNAAIANGETAIDLMGDIAVGEQILIPEGAKITMNLNGKTLSSATGTVIRNEGALTLVGKGTVESAGQAYAIRVQQGTMIIDSADINVKGAFGAVSIFNGADVTINGGNFNAEGINGMTSHTVYVSNSTLTVNGGTFDSGYSSEGIDTICGSNSTITLNDGTFYASELGESFFLKNVTSVKGGTYQYKPANIAAGYKAVETTNGYMVISGDVNYVADGVLKSADENTYFLSNKAGYDWMEKQDDGFFAGKTVELNASIDFGGATIGAIRFWNPENKTTFDGNGNTISNFVVENNEGNAGLFNGTMTVKNLVVDNANVTGQYAGVIAGNMYGDIENVTVKNSVVNGTYWQTGALVGQYNAGNVTNCVVEDCTINGLAAVGALVGIVNETAGERNFVNCTVKNCEINQTGSFGSNYDEMFGVAVGLVNIDNSTVSFNECTFEGNTVKGVASDVLCGVVGSGTSVTDIAATEEGFVLAKDCVNGGLYLYDTAEYTGTELEVPAGVTAIGNYAFAYNNTIETVVLPATVTDLGRGFDSSAVKKVVLNEGLKTISSRAFRSTTALEEVVIPTTVMTIADNAFQKSAIKEIVIPDSVETIGEAAFGSSKIEKVTFEGNTSIQGYAFRGCPNLREVYLKGDDVTFIASTLNGRNSCWFCNGESNNPNTSNITFYVVNETVAARVKTAMGAEAANTPVYVNGVLYEG